MQTILRIEKMKDKSGKTKNAMFITLRTNLPTGKKILDADSKPTDELLVLNAIAELPENTPLYKEIEEITVSMLKDHKKKNEKNNIQSSKR